MSETGPRHRCPACTRGVLNRHVKHCLYCGAALPASCLASPDESAAVEAGLRKAGEPIGASPAFQASPAKDVLQGVDAAGSLIDTISDFLN